LKVNSAFYWFVLYRWPLVYAALTVR